MAQAIRKAWPRLFVRVPCLRRFWPLGDEMFYVSKREGHLSWKMTITFSWCRLRFFNHDVIADRLAWDVVDGAQDRNEPRPGAAMRALAVAAPGRLSNSKVAVDPFSK